MKIAIIKGVVYASVTCQLWFCLRPNIQKMFLSKKKKKREGKKKKGKKSASLGDVRWNKGMRSLSLKRANTRFYIPVSFQVVLLLNHSLQRVGANLQ